LLYKTAEHRKKGIELILDALDGPRSVILSTHLNADGDGAGSEAAVSSWLRARGIEAWIVNPTPFPPSFAWLLEDESWVLDPRDPETARICREADLLLVLDTGEVPRIGRVNALVKHLPVAVVDHHPLGDQPFQGPDFRDTTAAAAGELIFDLVAATEGPWTRSVVEGLYVAILTDTGSFAFSNSSPTAFRVMAELVELGANPEVIHRRCYGSVPARKLRLVERCLKTLEVDEEGTTAWMIVPPEDFEAVGAELEDLEGLADYPRSIEGVEVGILFRTTDDGSTKISFRSNGRVDVNAIARSLGGGGHVRAAGALIPRSVPEVMPEAVEAVRAAVAALDPAPSAATVGD
jgi:phosphoesterase RecJ-like protein